MKNADKIEAIKSGKPIRTADFVFFAVLAAAILAGCYFMYWSPPKTPAESVAVRYNDGKTQTFDLHTDATHILADGALTLVIQDKACFVTDSKCPDRVCEHMGKINRVNQKIVCLPQGIVIRISGESEIHFYS